MRTTWFALAFVSIGLETSIADLVTTGGGRPAVAFLGGQAFNVAVTLVLDDTEHRFLVSSLALIMALLVAQTRIEAGVHSTLEVAYGALIGATISLAVFQLFF